MREIQLTRGYVALVDDEDYEWAMKYKWQVRVSGRCAHAKRTLKSILMHRELLEYHGFDLTGKTVDHINRNGCDNRKENLRICLHRENLCNSEKPRGDYTSKYKGVHFDKVNNKWRAVIRFNRKTFWSKRYLTEDEAIEWYNDNVNKIQGIFGLKNNV